MAKKLRAGIIGYGYMGQIRQKNISDHPNLELVGICDPARSEVIVKQNIAAFERW